MKKSLSLFFCVLLALSVLSSACIGTPPPAPVAPAAEQPEPPAPLTPAAVPLPTPAAPTAPAAIEPPAILANSAQVDFPAGLDFSLKARSSVNITDIRLIYSIDADSFAPVASEIAVEFIPSPEPDVTWSWDMRKTGGLPPGAGVEYRWTVRDGAGNKTETPSARISFDDNRYEWQSIAENDVTIYWYSENATFAEELMSASQQALTRLAASTGAALKKPVRIYIYASQQDLLGAMIFPQEWTGGAAYTEFGIIILGIGPGNMAWGRTAIAHELTHLVIHQMTFNPYNELPTWLDEGLAMYNQGPLEASFADSLSQATRSNKLISVRSLASPFSAFADVSYQSYAQSRSIVEFLVTGYGQGKMLELLNTFSEGASYDGALNKVYGFDMDGLNTLWRVSLAKRYQESQRTATAMSPHLFSSRLFNDSLSFPAQAGNLYEWKSVDSPVKPENDIIKRFLKLEPLTVAGRLSE